MSPLQTAASQRHCAFPPSPTLLLVSANKPYSIMAAPCGVGGVSVPLCMTVHIDVSIIKFKIKFTRISEIINKELKF